MTDIKGLLGAVSSGELSVEEAEKQLGAAVITDICHTKIDNLRGCVKGTPEVIYGAGKSAE